MKLSTSVRVLLSLCLLATLIFTYPLIADAETRDDDELALAKQVVDRGIAIIKENPEAGWDEVNARLSEMMADTAIPHLSEDQAAEFRQYIETRSPEVQPMIERLRQPTDLPGDIGAGDIGVPQPPQYELLSGEACPPTYCMVFFELNCYTDQLVGPCFGLWECDRTKVIQCEHPQAIGPCETDADCPNTILWFNGQDRIIRRCATWVFKDNECVRTCDDDADCPRGKKCGQPFGTNFSRCK